MVNYIVKISGVEYTAKYVRFREIDPHYNWRETATVLMDIPYDTAKSIFTDPGEWSVLKRFTSSIPDEEPETDIVIDCTDYDVLCCITDHQDGVLEVVIGKMTDSEALAELKEALMT